MEVQIQEDNPVHVDIFNARFEYENGLSDKCKIIKISKSQNSQLFEIKLSHLKESLPYLKESNSLDKKHCILGKNLFLSKQNDMGYFVYEHYDHNLLKQANHNDIELRRVS